MDEYKQIISIGALIGVAIAFTIIIYTLSNSYQYKQGFFDGIKEICKDKAIFYQDNVLKCEYPESLINDEVLQNEIRFFTNDKQP